MSGPVRSVALAFQLVPFAPIEALSDLALTGRVERSGREVQIDYRLQGSIEALAIPELAAAPERSDGLWQATCFEAFLAVPGAEPYWELNLSPAGHWNIYRLSSYRKGLKAEALVQALPFQRSDSSRALELSLTWTLPAGIKPEQPLVMAITAVLEQRDDHLSYWALAHPGPEADFHRRDGFLLQL